MTTTFNAAATKTVGVNATNFEFTFTRLERIAFGPGKITTLGAELERMGAARAGRDRQDLGRLAAPRARHGGDGPALRRRVRGRRAACARKFGAGPRGRGRAGRR